MTWKLFGISLLCLRRLLADVVSYDMAPCHIPCNNPSVPPMWIFHNNHHRRIYNRLKLLHNKNIGIKCISRSTFNQSNIIFDTIWCEYLSSLGTPLSKVALAGMCVCCLWGQVWLWAPSLGVKSICYNPSDGHLSHSLSLTSHDIRNLCHLSKLYKNL